MAIVGAAMQIAFWVIILPAAITLIINLFGSMIYAIGVFFFQIMDILQSTFRKLAGLGGKVALQGEWTDGDIVTLLLKSDVVIDTLISVTIFSIGLVILASIVQMIRLEYTTEGSKNSKEQIFAKAGKSILMFVFIPIVCFVGIRLSNYVLQGLDYATSSSGASTVSGSVFAASTADASKVYDSSKAAKVTEVTDLLGSWLLPLDYTNAVVEGSGGSYYIKHFKNMFNCTTTESSLPSVGGTTRVTLANQVSQAFTFLDGRDPIETSPGTVIDSRDDQSGLGGTSLENGQRLSYMSIDAVNYFYNTGDINYLILFIGCYIGIKTLFTASMGLIARLYKLGALFVLAPAAIGLQPLDDGNAYKKWRSNFISNVLSCYGIIVALNLYFMLVGVLQTIELWEGWIFFVANKFIQCLFVLTGATMINELASLVSGAIGAGDVMSDGDKASKGVGELGAKVQKFTAAPVAAGLQWAGHKMAEHRALNKKTDYVRNEKGEIETEDASFLGIKYKKKKTQRVASLNERRRALTSAQDDFNSEYSTEDGKTFKDKDGNVLTDATAIKNAKDKYDRMTQANNDLNNNEFAAQQAARAGQHNFMAGMSANRIKKITRENATGMFSPMQNLIGGSDYVTGKGFAGLDEKYISGVVKDTFDGDEGAFKNMMGQSPDDMAGYGGYKKGIDATKGVPGKIGGFLGKGVGWVGSKVTGNSRLDSLGVGGANAIATGYMDRQSTIEQATTLRDQVTTEANNVIKSSNAMQSKLTEGGKIVQDSGYHEASSTEMEWLKEFKQALTNFASGQSDNDSLNNSAEMVREYFSGAAGTEGRENAGVTQMINEIMGKIGEYGIGSAAAREAAATFSNTKFEDATLRAVIQDGDNANRSAGYLNTEQQSQWNAAQNAKDAAQGRLNKINSDEVTTAIANGDAEALGKALKQLFGGENGEIEQAFKEAIKGLEDALSKGNIKADLAGLADVKLKFDDSSVTKLLADIKAAIEAKQNGDDDKTLKDILKQLKKNGK